MTASNWTELLEDSGGVEKFYKSGPDLSSCNLVYLHLDERHQSLTLCLEADEPFSPSRKDENPTVRDVVEFHLTFSGVRDLECNGWQNYADKTVAVHQCHSGDGIHASITGRDEFVKFTADNASIIHSQARRMAAE